MCTSLGSNIHSHEVVSLNINLNKFRNYKKKRHGKGQPLQYWDLITSHHMREIAWGWSRTKWNRYKMTVKVKTEQLWGAARPAGDSSAWVSASFLFSHTSFTWHICKQLETAVEGSLTSSAKYQCWESGMGKPAGIPSSQAGQRARSCWGHCKTSAKERWSEQKSSNVTRTAARAVFLGCFSRTT